jgi:hypothetical protein
MARSRRHLRAWYRVLGSVLTLSFLLVPALGLVHHAGHAHPHEHASHDHDHDHSGCHVPAAGVSADADTADCDLCVLMARVGSSGGEMPAVADQAGFALQSLSSTPKMIVVGAEPVASAWPRAPPVL